MCMYATDSWIYIKSIEYHCRPRSEITRIGVGRLDVAVRSDHSVVFFLVLLLKSAQPGHNLLQNVALLLVLEF